MANATNTTAGDIQLAGDLAGNNDATAPALSNTAVTPGSYTYANVTIDSKGRITAASNGTDLVATGDLNGTVGANELVNTAVSPGSYSLANITVDAKGRITAASNGTTLAGDVTGPLNATVLANTAVSPGSYSLANITVDEKGRLTAASNSSLSGDVTGPANATVLSNSGVSAGSYSFANITVDSKGRITAASNGSVTLSGDVSGPTNSTVLANTAVTPGSYTYANITVDAKGRVTAASNGTVTLAGDVTGPASATVLANTAVTPGSYVASNITVDSKGRITAASNGDVVPDATYAIKGVVQIDDTYGLTITDGVLSIQRANGDTQYGVVEKASGGNIDINSNGQISVGSNIPKLDTTNTFTKAQHTTPFALTSGTTVTVDGSQSNVYTLTLEHNATLANPTNLGAGKYTFIIKQDGAGSRTLAFGSAYKFPSGHDTAISSAANSVNVLWCTSNGTDLFCSLAKNFA